jgi:membrane fusion protein (multidrug efflux system)
VLLTAEAAPVFVKKAEALEKEFTLELYGNFIHEEVTAIYSPIVGVVDSTAVKKGEYVKNKRILFTVLRDDPGFTKQKKKITAPFSGVVKVINAYRGSRISPQSPVMMIAVVDPIYFYANVAEEDMGKISAGDPVNIEVAYLAEPVAGKIVSLLDIDPAKKMAPVKIRVPNPTNRIAAGTEGKILYSYNKGNIVIIPAGAVFAEKGRYFAWVKEDGKARKREISIGELTGRGFECLAGISGGEDIIYYGYLDLKPGDPVKAVEFSNEY